MARGLVVAASRLPDLVDAAGETAQVRYLEFFAAAIRNPNTRRAYHTSSEAFLHWCRGAGVQSLTEIHSLHVASWIESLSRQRPAPTVKLRLAAIRHLFDWLVTGQILAHNPAASVRGPRHSTRRGKTPALDPEETRRLLDSIDISTPTGLRDRALIALMVYSFARIGAALSMKVGDVYVQNRRLRIRLYEKGGKDHDMPCHHTLEEYLAQYIEVAGIAGDHAAPLFPTVSRLTGRLSRVPLSQSNAHAMIRRRTAHAGIETKVGNHSFRATGITAYLKNGGTLETAAAMANHASTRTTQLYDRRPDELTLDEIERIRI